MKNFKSLGVINLTPDSFSDGGLSLDPSYLSKQIKDFLENDFLYLDIGAESTAPSNNPIDGDLEINRYEKYFFPFVELIPDNITISFDTYRASTFRFLINKMLELNKAHRLIWNDVSGEIDEDVFSILREYANIEYVFSHNLALSREQTSSHMDFRTKEKIITHVSNYFLKEKTILKEKEILDRVWFDPCFGFSKSYEQNIELLENFEQVLKNVRHDKWLIGISKKSFLKKKVQMEGVLTQENLERLHLYYLQNITKSLGETRALFRIHNPKLWV